MVGLVLNENGLERFEFTKDNSYDVISNLVGGLLECAFINELEDIDVFVNEEGKLIGLEPRLFIDYDVLCGNVVFVKANEEGETIGLEEEDIQKVIAYIEG